MKWMKKLRLINWHYFRDETLEFGRQTLVSGRNAAGKSTIIDALQVLLVANQRQIRFNSAAHEDAKRSLINYLRGKKGTDQQVFVREGSFTSYIVAEFRDEKKRETFVVGVVIDVYLDGEIEEEYFLLPETILGDLDFVNKSGQLRNREEFKRSCTDKNSRAKFERNKGTYQKLLLTRMGHVRDRFFSIFTKALSFKPIQNVREFVHDYILDRRELQLDLMKQNFEIHERYKREFDDMQQRKTSLEEISKHYEQYAEYCDVIAVQEHVIRRLKYVQEAELLEQSERVIRSLEEQIEQITIDMTTIERDQEEAQIKKDEAFQKWQGHELKQKRERLKAEIWQLREEIQQKSRMFKTFQDQILMERRMIEDLMEWQDESGWQWQEGELDKLKQASAVLADLSEEKDSPLWLEREYDLPKEELKRVGEFLAELHSRFTKSVGRLEDHLKLMEERKSVLDDQIRDLQNKKLMHSEHLRNLKSLLEQRLAGRSCVWVFCEELEVVDEQWRNAVEGYLNTQRFDLLVEPQVFAEALSIYEHEKRKHGLEGVGLVDTDKELRHMGTAKPGSLADVLATDNPVIQARIDHLLGHVMKARDEQELRQHRTAVTMSCMSYNNLVARQIPRRVYDVPYIGAQAIVRQLEIARREHANVQEQLRQGKDKWKQLLQWEMRLAEKRTHYLLLTDHLILPVEISQFEQRIGDRQQELEELDTTEVDQIREEYEFWNKRQKELVDSLKEISAKKAGQEGELKQRNGELYTRKIVRDEAERYWKAWNFEYSLELLPKVKDRWKEAELQDIPTANKITNWVNNQKGYETRRDNKFRELRDSRAVYNARYTYTKAADASDNADYQSLLDHLELVDIPKYQKLLEEALRQSEEEFQSHFVYRLREAIEMAKREFKELNHALDNFAFTDDKYQFKVDPSGKYKRFYDVIMDPQVVEKGSLFDWQEEEKISVLHELFEKLVGGEIGDQDEFTDYRSYLDFDIIITSHGERTAFSSVLREKSGGETQTPFYIAILASFNHLYSDKTMRLVIFDEAFNKMDEERIQKALRLIKRMGLQLIAAVPDEKMPHMAPEVSTTLVVQRQGFECFVDLIDCLETNNELEERGGTDHVSERNVPIQNSLFTFDEI